MQGGDLRLKHTGVHALKPDATGGFRKAGDATGHSILIAVKAKADWRERAEM